MTAKDYLSQVRELDWALDALSAVLSGFRGTDEEIIT